LQRQQQRNQRQLQQQQRRMQRKQQRQQQQVLEQPLVLEPKRQQQELRLFCRKQPESEPTGMRSTVFFS
jgi:hypothetical protein